MARWGKAQASAYQKDLFSGFQYLADRHDRSPQKSTGVRNQRLHRVNQHYVALLVLTPDAVALAKVRHAHVDESTRLRNAQARISQEVADVRHAILKDNLSGGI